ncbi:dienelactone hydrolase family protein [Curvibacter sp. APW13]|uniref:alpha/beta hydrolase n=1 Tax=Curvibacter sp. APW13 TaxID=3077236 RepID=UPI0028DE61C1|nr:dienelactone hydrolase family protein [Curvibacter sp. APW13]MDT8992481.1 dienelactone hydrolase family protein [Curvibacter sp. APW13]
MTDTPLLPHLTVETASAPTAAVIWLHGLGADGHDFAGLVPELDLRGCPPIRFIFPHAPSIPVTINNGYVMPAWFDILGMNGQGPKDEAGIRRSQTQIHALIAQERARGIAAEHIVLAGFSQGCAMALHTGLRLTERLAGIVALSGFLPLPETMATERHPANAQTPVFMAHGSMDPVVRVERGTASRDTLLALGQPVDWHSYPMEHSLCAEEVADISAFLRRVLPKT